MGDIGSNPRFAALKGMLGRYEFEPHVDYGTDRFDLSNFSAESRSLVIVGKWPFADQYRKGESFIIFSKRPWSPKNYPIPPELKEEIGKEYKIGEEVWFHDGKPDEPLKG